MVDINALYDDLNNRYGEIEQELQTYQNRMLPKYDCGNIIFFVDVQKEETGKLIIDEIIINKIGISYREYINENEFKQYPECFSFTTEEESLKYLEYWIEEKNKNKKI